MAARQQQSRWGLIININDLTEAVELCEKFFAQKNKTFGNLYKIITVIRDYIRPTLSWILEPEC